MKKLSSILCVAICVIVGAMMFSGCGSNKSKNQSTITLAEAKTVIVNALKIDKVQSQAVTYALSDDEQENRDLLEKLGKFTVVCVGKSYSYPSNQKLSEQSFNGNFEYKDGYFLKYDLSLNGANYLNMKEYLNDGTVYINNNENITTQEATDTRGFGYANSMGESYILMLDSLFSDKAFEKVYKKDVVKDTTSDGYSFTLKLDFKGYYRLTTMNSMTDEAFETFWAEQEQTLNNMPQALKENNEASVVINFNKNDEILSVSTKVTNGTQVTVNGNVTLMKNESSVTITKYTGEIVEPQWVTDYKLENN